MEEICRRMALSPEDTELAKIIALLHDIGRFEQLKRFDSFEPDYHGSCCLRRTGII